MGNLENLQADRITFWKKQTFKPIDQQEPTNYNFSQQATSVLKKQRTKKAADKVIVNISPISHDSRLKPVTSSQSNKSRKLSSHSSN